MSEMIEKIARAICRPLCRGDFHPCDTADGVTCKPDACGHWRTYEDSARAVIEAMREPTGAMVEAVSRFHVGKLRALAECVRDENRNGQDAELLGSEGLPARPDNSRETPVLSPEIDI